MFIRMAWLLLRGAALSCALAPAVYAHHVMEYATPATALEGFLSGLGHPVIGVDHLLFVVGAGVLAARFERGALLPLFFIVASTLAVCLRAAGSSIPVSELWVAGSIAVLGAMLVISPIPGRGIIAALFVLAGALHGYALAEGIVGAERTPLYAYLVGLTLVLSLIACSAWAVAFRLSRARPGMPLYRASGFALAIAGLYFMASAAMG